MSLSTDIFFLCGCQVAVFSCLLFFSLAQALRLGFPQLQLGVLSIVAAFGMRLGRAAVTC